MTIPDTAVQAALEAYLSEDPYVECLPNEQAMQAALAAAFPVMLREVAGSNFAFSEAHYYAIRMAEVGKPSDRVERIFRVMLVALADTYGTATTTPLPSHRQTAP